MSVLAAGALVGAAVWCATAPPGRRAEELADRSARPVVRRRLPTWRKRGNRRGGEDPVRVAVALVVGLLRSGTPPGAAWSRALRVPTAHDGVPEIETLTRVVGDRSGAAAVVAAARLSRDVGAPLGGVLEAVGAALVARAEARADREASLAGPRATARVLLWLPALGVVFGAALGADPLATATDGGFGTAAVVLGLMALLAGRWWTGRLVTAARAAGEVP
ncbi:type II secretion system F family protein [Isoptericola aurantiacus]|uniref:type II secretion system F family protein n=1 Tax=Isoptericola aurantiacus TaxID=3377839 RepID=UPI00383AE1E2